MYPFPYEQIQYSSSSDEQWKFPLVQELAAAIVAAKHMLGMQSTYRL
jgi:hypothetical protein